VQIGDRLLHVLASHPTPPIFDGPEDSNGRRNFDEIRLWADYIVGGDRAAYIRDDAGKSGGIARDAGFVVMGDLNSDPVRSDQPYGKTAVRQLLDLPAIHDPKPRSEGSLVAPHAVDLEDYLPYRTSKFGRIDYCLPSRGIRVLESRVFWPAPNDPLHALIDPPEPASDHYPVWVDLALPGR
jgi:endonuclease/exonuclease/phosphatase family metal-dependent hydrolase